MVTSIILINAERNRINELAEQLQAMDGVSEVYSVSGKYDLVVIIRVKTNDDLADLVTRRMVALEGIVKTETMLAFQAFSRHDLEAMFAVGMSAAGTKKTGACSRPGSLLPLSLPFFQVRRASRRKRTHFSMEITGTMASPARAVTARSSRPSGVVRKMRCMIGR